MIDKLKTDNTMEKERIAHCIIKIILFIIFFFVFGKPSYNAVLRKDMVMKQSIDVVDIFPDISICLV